MAQCLSCHERATALLASRLTGYKSRPPNGLRAQRARVRRFEMRQEIAAVDQPAARGKGGHLVGPGLKAAAAIETNLDRDAPERIAWLGGPFIVVELREQAVGVFYGEDLAHHARAAVWVEHRARIPTAIVKRARNGAQADELGLSLETLRQRIGEA